VRRERFGDVLGDERERKKGRGSVCGSGKGGT